MEEEPWDAEGPQMRAAQWRQHLVQNGGDGLQTSEAGKGSAAENAGAASVRAATAATAPPWEAFPLQRVGGAPLPPSAASAESTIALSPGLLAAWNEGVMHRSW